MAYLVAFLMNDDGPIGGAGGDAFVRAHACVMHVHVCHCVIRTQMCVIRTQMCDLRGICAKEHVA